MKHQNKRLTFGLLIDSVFSGYHRCLLSGIVDLVREKGINLLCFVTGRFNAEDILESSGNVLFDFVDKSNIDGLIVVTTAIQNMAGKSPLLGFLNSFYPLPIVSIGEAIENSPSFIIDNEKGMSDLLIHFVDVHNYRRIAFITGPAENSEAAGRLNAYKNFLLSRNIPVDPELIIEGNFFANSGKTAIRALLQKNIPFDAIVASNDLMALAAVEELALSGIHVPGDTFIAGFDDIEASKNASLTTIRQPLVRQGYSAASALSRLLNGESCSLINYLPTELITRESCGCYSQNLVSCAAWKTAYSNETVDKALTEHGTEIAGAVEKVMEAYFPPSGRGLVAEWSVMLYETFLWSFETMKPDIFLRAWSRVILFTITEKLDFSCLQQIISVLRNNIVCYNADYSRRLFLEDQFHKARIMIEEAVQKAEGEQKQILALQEEKLNDIGARLTEVSSLDELLDVIYREFPPMGMKSCYLSLYEKKARSESISRLILAFRNNVRLTAVGEGIVFPTKELIPALYYPADDPFVFVIQSIACRNERIGFILMELSGSIHNAATFSVLCTKLTATLRLIILLERTIDQARRLRAFNRRLKQNNQQLQDFTYAASHDLQEPLRKIITFGDRLKDKYFRVLEEQGQDYLERMQKAAVRMQKLIDGLLAYSRAATGMRQPVPVDLSKIAEGVLSDLEIQIEKTAGRVEIASLPVIRADPTEMRQLFQNLISNGLKYHKPGSPPLVRIYILNDPAGRYNRLVVEDNGIGIDEEDFDKIFRLFGRLHGRSEYEGNGIGLAVCRKITEKHRGTIRVESRKGEGTRFIVSFPVKGQ